MDAFAQCLLQAKRERQDEHRRQSDSLLREQEWAASAGEVEVDTSDPHSLIHWGGGDAQRDAMSPYVSVIPDFVTPAEEEDLAGLIKTHLGGVSWESAHIDSLIRSYREGYVKKAEAVCPALQRLDAHVEEKYAIPLTDHYHFLEYRPDGYVKPHFDNEAESSHVVAGLSLLDTRVMTLTKEGEDSIELLLPPRSLYVLSGPCRYTWLHGVDCKPGREIHRLPEVFFKGMKVKGCLRGGRRCVVVRGTPLSVEERKRRQLG
eukprot:TRINITY_DN43971_c0_g1_i1.p1 TRINITY_DN43971_c0_g1~~TRINITY_DN43971_c0_g1_i1.p1  ORF type:complete len:261 (+),score=79.80 TRINITY_DN43971_c0_g1_i1:96-878(+)